MIIDLLWSFVSFVQYLAANLLFVVSIIGAGFAWAIYPHVEKYPFSRIGLVLVCYCLGAIGWGEIRYLDGLNKRDANHERRVQQIEYDRGKTLRETSGGLDQIVTDLTSFKTRLQKEKVSAAEETSRILTDLSLKPIPFPKSQSRCREPKPHARKPKPEPDSNNNWYRKPVDPGLLRVLKKGRGQK